MYKRQNRYRAHFREAFTAAIAALPSEQAHLLRLHVIDQLNIDQIGALYGIHRATAARKVNGARTALFEQTRAELMTRLRVSRNEFDGIMDLVRSHLDVSIAGALAARPSFQGKIP